MVQDVVIEPVGGGPHVSITADGAELGHMANGARIELEAGAFPLLILKIPFMRCKYNGKCVVHLEGDGADTTIVDALRAENKVLKQIIEDQNRKIAILLDT